MRSLRLVSILGLFAVAAALAASLRTPESSGGGLPADQKPAKLADVDIQEKPGALLPKELLFTDESGRKAPLGELLGAGRPLLLVLAYYRCPMLCSLVINGLFDGLGKLEWSAGERYDVAVVSIDPRDTVEVAGQKRQGYLAKYNRPTGAAGVHFYVGAEQDVKALADRVGFHYKWSEADQQYSHAAGVFVFNKNAELSRTLFGIQFPADTLKLALNEAAEGRLGQLWDKVLLFCYHYDPNARKYVASAWKIMRIGGALTLLGMGLLLAFVWRGGPGTHGDTAAPAA
jgi:protein SCO1/2